MRPLKHKGQGIVEYILLIVIILGILGVFLVNFSQPVSRWIQFVAGAYVECLLDEAVLPTLGGDTPSFEDCEIPDFAFSDFSGGGAYGNGQGGRNGSSGGSNLGGNSGIRQGGNQAGNSGSGNFSGTSGRGDKEAGGGSGYGNSNVASDGAYGTDSGRFRVGNPGQLSSQRNRRFQTRKVDGMAGGFGRNGQRLSSNGFAGADAGAFGAGYVTRLGSGQDEDGGFSLNKNKRNKNQNSGVGLSTRLARINRTRRRIVINRRVTGLAGGRIYENERTIVGFTGPTRVTVKKIKTDNPEEAFSLRRQTESKRFTSEAFRPSKKMKETDLKMDFSVGRVFRILLMVGVLVAIGWFFIVQLVQLKKNLDAT